MGSVIQDLSINFNFFLDLFQQHHGGSSSSWQPLAVSAAMLTQAIGSKIYNFDLMYLSKEPMNFNVTK